MSDVIGKGSIIDVNGVKSDIKEINELLTGLKTSIKEVIDSSEKLGSSLGGTTYNEAVSGAVRYGETRRNLTAVEKEHARILALVEKEEAKRIKRQDEEYVKQVKRLQELKKENTEEIRLEKEKVLAKKQALKEEIRLRKEQSAQEKARLLEEKQAIANKKLLIQSNNLEKGSIAQLSVENKILQAEMNKLNVLIPEQSKRYKELFLAVQNNKQAMVEYAMSQGGVVSGSKKVKHEFNGIAFQTTQLIRELPSLAYGPQMFIAAISNNFPYLIDEIKAAKLATMELNAAGKQGVPVWKQVGKSIFSVQSLIVLAITAFMLYNKEITAFVKSLFKLEKALDSNKYVQEALHKTQVNAAKSAVDEKVKLELLNKTILDSKKPIEEQLAAKKELIKLYPNHFKNISAETLTLDQLSVAYKDIRKEIDALSVSEEAYKAIVDEEQRLVDLKEEEKLLRAKSDALREQVTAISDLMKAGSSQDYHKALVVKKTIQLEKTEKKIQKSLEDQGAAMKNIVKQRELYKQMVGEDEEPTKGGRQTKAEELDDNRLALLKLKNAEDVIKFQMMQKNEWLKFVEKTNADEKLLESEKNNKIAAFEAEQAVKLIVVKQELNKKIIDLINVISNEEIEAAKGDAVKIENIKRATTVTLNEIANEQLDFTKEMNNEATDEQIRQAESDKKIAQEKAKILSDITLKENDRLAKEAILASKETALAQINVRKLNNRKIEALQRELAENELENLILASEKAIESSNLTYEAKKEEEERLLELKSRYKDLLIEHSKEANDDQTAELVDWLNAVSEIYNALFDFINNLYEKQLQAAKKAYEMESTYAGASVEAKIMAEKKYEKKQVEIKKKQANAQKLQSGLNVLMTMLELTPKALAGDPMAIAGLIAGGISLAAIATEPIPAFVEGGQHKGGTAKVSEEGQELFIDKKKRAFLTPKEETISYFPAGEFIPHDETQRLLAKYAMNQQSEILDMTGTNGYLRNIERNTRKKGETNYISDYKIIYRNGIKSKIRV